MSASERQSVTERRQEKTTSKNEITEKETEAREVREDEKHPNGSKKVREKESQFMMVLLRFVYKMWLHMCVL